MPFVVQLASRGHSREKVNVRHFSLVLRTPDNIGH
jgi:hypothetical protein